MENTVLGILPEHLLSGIPAADLPDQPFNQAPVGTGPYRFDQVKSRADSIASMSLHAWSGYYGAAPLIPTVAFIFYDNDQDLIAALRTRAVDAIHQIPSSGYDEIKELRNINILSTQLPQQQAVFFNTKGKDILQNAALRKAFALAIGRDRIVDEVLHGQATVADGPLPKSSWAYVPPVIETEISGPDQARQILADAGYTDTDNDGYLDMEGAVLGFDLLSDDNQERSQIALMIAEMEKQIGVKVDVKLFGVGTFINDYLRTRNYDAVLIGQNYTWDPDVYAYWDSSQIGDPGLNISQYANNKVDKLLEDARRLSDNAKRREKYTEFQRLIREDVPAVFLYTPLYHFAVNKAIHNVQLGFVMKPSDQYSTLSSWYIKTKRVKMVEDKSNVQQDAVEEVRL
jgi:peptide/nickel transport system substrate-binding protein